VDKPSSNERIRWAIYAGLMAALKTGHPRRFAVARALDKLAQTYGDDNG
jgi:hypothetical protein